MPRKTVKPAPKAPMGRPPKSDEERMVVLTVRVTPAQREKYQQLGAERLRAWLERAS